MLQIATTVSNAVNVIGNAVDFQHAWPDFYFNLFVLSVRFEP